ncbi:S1 family peptidase [Oceanidesulfovibrio marinus]|uniref:Serine protease n=1 Tax=Oceanidesulfovibrio marinus TaxID=370038 RepID=A0A6P1ZEB2_9BACT|nr:serine protease [Oceanidesulfovibrio marinus]QJT10807.1 trypsin-like peptidase domain-containing protein [Oceanidesulfovibrio marinus]TVM31888.1 serine protease [Oceanidesulfovibrio marinus]
MLQDVYLRYRGGCMKLFCLVEGELTFMGTAFLAHQEGYLVTVAHILYKTETLMVTSADFSEEFAPGLVNTFTAMPVSVVAMDKEHDIALLKFDEPMELSLPDHVMGRPDEIPVGSTAACIGFPYGFYNVFSQVIQACIVSAKVISRNETRILLFDSTVQEGMRGSPLVSAYDGRIIGIVGGRFDPEEAGPGRFREEVTAALGLSYAISSEYAVALLESQGEEAI